MNLRNAAGALFIAAVLRIDPSFLPKQISSLRDRSTLWAVGLCASLFVLSSSYFDIERPDWTIEQHYYLVIFDLVLVAFLASVLFAGSRGGTIAVVPPDRRIAMKGPDPLLTLRAFACFLVFMGHYFAVVFPIGTLSTTLKSAPSYALLTSCPWAGVWIFYCLSGYLMGKGFFLGRYGLTADGLRRFYTNRLLRIYPVYVSAILIVGILQTPQLFTAKLAWNLLQALLFNAAGIEVYLPVGALNTLSTEFQFYMLAPFFGLLILKIEEMFEINAAFIVIILAIGACLRYEAQTVYQAKWPYDVYVPFISNADLFFSGMLCAKIVTASKQRSGAFAPIAAIIGIPVFYAAISYAAAFCFYQGNDFACFTSLAPTASAIFALAFIAAFEQRLKMLDRIPICRVIVRWTQIFGILTFCIYVWHSQIMLAIRSTMPKSLSSLTVYTTLPLVVVIVAIFAVGFYWTVERPFEQMKIRS